MRKFGASVLILVAVLLSLSFTTPSVAYANGVEHGVERGQATMEVTTNPIVPAPLREEIAATIRERCNLTGVARIVSRVYIANPSLYDTEGLPSQHYTIQYNVFLANSHRLKTIIADSTYSLEANVTPAVVLRSDLCAGY